MRPPNATESDAHLPGIDVLRGLAAVAVMLFHAYGYAYGPGFNAPGTPFDYFLAHRSVIARICFPAAYGNGGVPVFFLLSGFCIHYGHARRPAAGLRPGAFLARRFWRLYPAYLVSILVILVVNTSVPPLRAMTGHVSAANVAAHLLLVHNLVSPATFAGIDPPYWSLGIEWQYYLLYPAALLAAARLNVGVGTAVAMAAAVSLAVGIGIGVWPDQAYRLLLPFGYFQWTLGAWLARRHVERRSPLVRVRVAAPVAIGIVVVASRSPNHLVWEWFGWALLGGAVLERWVRTGTRLAVGPLVWLGGVSYSLYLWHGWWVTLWTGYRSPPHPGRTLLCSVLVGGVASVATAAVSYYAVEVPGVALGRRLVGHRRRTVPLANAAAP